MIDLIEKDNTLTFSVRVVPRSSRSEIIGEYNGSLKVKLNSPPADGAANAELIKLLAKEFGVSRAQVEIINGATKQLKHIKISTANQDVLTKIFLRSDK